MTKAFLANVALFLSGLLAGGVPDHGLLALRSSEVTSYGIHVGVVGNWAFMVFDAAVAVALLVLHRRWSSS